jgi:DNA-binding PadR family transcriptional regulator
MDWGDETISVSQAEMQFLSLIQLDGQCTAGRLMDACVVADASVYKILHRMVAKGIVEAHRERRAGSRAKFVHYRLSMLGSRMLRAIGEGAKELEPTDYTHPLKEPIDKPRARTRSKISGKARTAAG